MKKLSALILVLAMLLAMLAACGDNEINEKDPLVAAKDYIYSMYKENDGSVTSGDYQVVGVVKIDGTTFTVEWTVDTDKVKLVPDGKTVTVDVDEKSAEELTYTLTATVKDESGKSESCSFKHTVPAYKVNTWAEYAAAEKDAPLVVQGIVTGIISKSNDSTNNCLYIQDDVGGYYVYGMTNDPIADLGIEIGMKVEAKGVMDIYNGTLELKDATVTVLDVPAVTPEAVDYTELYKNASSLKDTALVEKQGLLVTIKGVELQAQTPDDVSGNYYRFKMGELSSYVRLSGSTCPINNAEKETFKAAFTEHVGYTADVTGVICVYDGAFYLTPVSADAYSNFAAIERTPAEKVAYEKELLSVVDSIRRDTEIAISATGSIYSDVSIKWTADNFYATITEDKISIALQEEAQTLTLTATLTCGDATDTVSFKIEMAAKPVLSAQPFTALTELKTGDKVYIYSPSAQMVMTGEVNDKNRMVGVESVLSGGMMTANADAILLTATVEGDTVYFTTADGKFLTSGETGNSLFLADELTDFAKWTLTKVEGTADQFFVTNLKAAYNESKQALEIYNGIFTTYGAKDTDIYKFQFFAEAPITAATELTAGQKVVIYSISDKKAMTSVVNDKNRMEGVDATVTDGVLTNNAEFMNLTVEIDADGNVAFKTDDGKYLTSGETGNSLFLADAISDFAKWTLTKVEGTADQFFVTNLKAAYNENKQAMEIYNGIFTTYGAKDTDIYKFQFFVTGAGNAAAGDSTGDKTDDKTDDKTEPDAGTGVEVEGGVKYTFADYEKGEQYAENEEHKLDDTLKVTTNEAHFTTEIRLYHSDVNEYNPNGRHATAVFESTKVITGLVINAGNKTDTLKVSGSTDGKTWTVIKEIPVVDAFADYSVSIENSTYKFIKLESTAKQIRVASITVAYAK